MTGKYSLKPCAMNPLPGSVIFRSSVQQIFSSGALDNRERSGNVIFLRSTSPKNASRNQTQGTINRGYTLCAFALVRLNSRNYFAANWRICAEWMPRRESKQRLSPAV